MKKIDPKSSTAYQDSLQFTLKIRSGYFGNSFQRISASPSLSVTAVKIANKVGDSIGELFAGLVSELELSGIDANDF